MNLIVRHTEYLLGHHDCVIVPGFGAFIANYLPAKIHEGQIWPPRRSLSFNGELTLGDGLLARSIARGEGISYDSATRLIAGKVDCFVHQLEADGSLSFGRLGKFVSQPGASPLFEAASPTAIANPFFALQPVEITTAQEQEESEAAQRRADRSHFYLPISRNFFKIAASVAMLVGVMMMLLSPLPISEVPQMASVACVSAQAPASHPSDRPIEIIPTKQANQQLFISIPAATDATAKVDTLAPRPAASSQRFLLVVASLASDAQARRFIAESGDPSLQVIEQQGKHRVFAAAGDSYESVFALRSRSDISSRYPDAWVCRR